ncbi:MAG: hypothetical protein MPI93_01955 [Nitrosopumilus sp.]|nr:hypothetical protein [Nitrosopumilus sp.]
MEFGDTMDQMVPVPCVLPDEVECKPVNSFSGPDDYGRHYGQILEKCVKNKLGAQDMSFIYSDRQHTEFPPRSDVIFQVETFNPDRKTVNGFITMPGRLDRSTTIRCEIVLV